MPGLRVGIVGAGIGGLAAALALSADGHEVTLYERRTGFGELGAGIQISPNAGRALDTLGVSGGLARPACEPAGIVIRGLRSGRDIANVELGRAMTARYGAPYRVVARSDLHTALLDAVRVRSNIRLLVGRKLVAAQDAAGSATLVIANRQGQREHAIFDLAIGADGLGSAARRALGDHRPPRFSGFAAARAVLSATTLPPEMASDRTGLWLGRNRHVVHYAIAGGRALNLVVIEPRRAAGSGWSEPVDPAELALRFRDAAASLQTILRQADAWSAWSLFDLQARTMHGRRIALVGDAAHPVLPYLAQGGALALEDAVELAARLRASGGSVEEALAAYGRVRLPRVRRVQNEARRNGRIYHLGGPAALARDLVMGALSPVAMAARYDWLYGWRPEGAVRQA